MVSKNRLQKIALKQDLLNNSQHYSYFQAIRLLKNLSDSKKDLKIKTRPDLSFSFPASDILSISCEHDEDKNIELFSLTASFLGLYGTSSPLPNFYTEDLFEEFSQDKSTCRDFLDIFHFRLYDLLFECWEKYKLFFQLVENNNSDFLNKIFCLLGLGEKELQKAINEPKGLIRYVGLLSQQPRSALGLRTLLRDATGTESLEIISCCLRKVSIPKDQRCCIGIGCSELGVNALIGTEVVDAQGKFRIEVGPLSAEEFRNFVPGSRGYENLINLTRLYMVTPLEYELHVKIDSHAIQSICLGGNEWSRLGVDTWLFTDHMLQDGVAFFNPC